MEIWITADENRSWRQLPLIADVGGEDLGILYEVVPKCRTSIS